LKGERQVFDKIGIQLVYPEDGQATVILETVSGDVAADVSISLEDQHALAIMSALEAIVVGVDEMGVEYVRVDIVECECGECGEDDDDEPDDEMTH
jgi:predicted metal-dependent phosphotriesterase family hydrolase